MARPQASVTTVALTVALLLALGLVAAQRGGWGNVTTAPADGFYINEQAELGEELYTIHCARCHGVHGRGDAHNPPVAGPDFVNRWSGEGVDRLYHYTRSTMPLDDPASLQPSEYIAVVAYTLLLSGFPPGSEPMPRDDGQLAQLIIHPENIDPEFAALLDIDEPTVAAEPTEPGAPGDPTNGVAPDPEVDDPDEAHEVDEPEEPDEPEEAAEPAAAPTAAPAAESSPADDAEPSAHYTEEQAERGLEPYDAHCAQCHGSDLQGDPPLVGADFLERYDTVADLHDFITGHMEGPSDGEYADIVALILRENDLPAGDQELPPDPDAMRDMPL